MIPVYFFLLVHLGYVDGLGSVAKFGNVMGIDYHPLDNALFLTDGIYIRKLQLDFTNYVTTIKTVPVSLISLFSIAFNHNYTSIFVTTTIPNIIKFDFPAFSNYFVLVNGNLI